MSVVRGRPPGLAGGISGSNRRNWSSVSAWPEPKSPTSARSAGVHIAVSKQKPSITPSDRPGSAHQTTPLVPLQTGSQPIEGPCTNESSSPRRGSWSSHVFQVLLYCPHDSVGSPDFRFDFRDTDTADTGANDGLVLDDVHNPRERQCF